mmetsp:Transcript_48033/g.102947  ORF Transcript_48033/g.102947 Transcript_48033/m.102947 type:complete len:593 (+) Transcript_48033:249-2027(+)
MSGGRQPGQFSRALDFLRSSLPRSSQASNSAARGRGRDSDEDEDYEEEDEQRSAAAAAAGGRGRQRPARARGRGGRSLSAHMAQLFRFAESASGPTSADPLGLEGELFEYISHKWDHGEAFVAYRVRGHPMILHSLVDGLPLASLHIRAVNSRSHYSGSSPSSSSSSVQSLIARRPDRGNSEFLGIISSDNQEFELVMTNLTAHDVMMFDIGGVARSREEEYWERTDPSFWSGKHRNDHRLNRSNILWPLAPNICSENHLYFQESGEHRRLVLRARQPGQAASAEGSGTAESDEFEGFSIFVYPKYGTKTAERFARTAWSCPEKIMVVGNPALLEANVREGHNIQADRSSNGGVPDPSDFTGSVAASIGIPRERLLQVLGLQDSALQEMDEQTLRGTIVTALRGADFSALENELPTPSNTQQTNAKRSRSGEGPKELGARPADVAAGRRVLGAGLHSLLIEKFDFERLGAPATISLGVRDGLEVLPTAPATERSSEPDMLEEVNKELEQLVVTRTAALMEDAQGSAVFDTPECVLCVDGPPDTVLYQCGHRCVHWKCVHAAPRALARCPLCRKPVVALLQLDPSPQTEHVRL